MIIRRSVKTNFITQYFGQNLNSFYNELGLKGHNGWDFSTYDNEPIYWDTNIIGKVIGISTDINEGYGITILTQEGNDYFQHRFWHLKKWSVKVGQEIKTGDLLGFADNTGRSTGTHLHRDLKPLIKISTDVLEHKYPNNGYGGAIDLKPFFENVFVWDWINITRQKVGIIKKLIYFYQEWLKIS